MIEEAADAVGDEELPFLRPLRAADRLLDEDRRRDRAVPPFAVDRYLGAAESGVQPVLQGRRLLRRQRELEAAADAAPMAELDVMLAGGDGAVRRADRLARLPEDLGGPDLVAQLRRDEAAHGEPVGRGRHRDEL